MDIRNSIRPHQSLGGSGDQGSGRNRDFLIGTVLTATAPVECLSKSGAMETTFSLTCVSADYFLSEFESCGHFLETMMSG